MSTNNSNDVGRKEDTVVQNIQTGQERAFYGSKNVHFKNITIDGIEQGESALKEWPYIMNVENTGSGKGLYQIIITDTSKSTIKRENLEYSLYLDDKEITTGKLSDIKDNVLYTGEIEGNKKQTYKLYIWVISDVDKEDTYEYKIEFNTIRSGGPGF